MFAGLPRDPVIVTAYRRVRRNARTLNELNKVHIQLENRMTPFERDSIARFVARFLTLSAGWRLVFRLHALLGGRQGLSPRLRRKSDRLEGSKVWLTRLKKNALHFERGVSEIWSRQAFSPGVFLYVRTDLDADLLVISVTGNRSRMGVALPEYLQALRGAKGDVMLVSKRRAQDYGSGIRGLGDTLGESIDQLSELVRTLNYRRVVVVGSSAGGEPAILAGFRINAQRILALGPGQEVAELYGSLLAGVVKDWGPNSGPVAPVTVAVGERAPERDHHSARYWEKTVGAEVVQVPQAGHSPMGELIRTNRLLEFLE